MTLRLIVRSLLCSSALLAVCSYSPGQGIPCSYKVAVVIQAPDGPISESPTYATAISPNGRYVVGRFRFDAVGQDRAFVYDTLSEVFQALPLPGASTNSFATDVTDDGVIVGHTGGSSGNDFGFIYPLSTGQYTLLPPLWVQGGVCWITGINSSGTVCGYRGAT